MASPDDSLREELAKDLASALMPFGGSVGRWWYRNVAGELRRLRSSALIAAETASGLTREKFREWIEEEPHAIPLYLKILWAAGMNGHEHTLQAMGVAMGRAASATARGDDQGFEEAELALRAMGELTPRHFRVLAAVHAGTVVIKEDGTENLFAFTPTRVAEASGVSLDVTNQCLLNLAGAGLVVARTVWGDTAYPLTDVGRAVISAAEEARDQTK